MAFKDRLIAQFRRPTGWAGRLAGRYMSVLPANRRRNAWTVDLLELKPSHRVLEIGFGPGIALQRVVRRLPEGFVVGLDHSSAMARQAAARNRVAIDAGRMVLVEAAVDDLARPELAGPFDRVYAVNVALFWDDPAAVFRRLAERLAAGGWLAITHQPRLGDRSDAAALAVARRLAAAMLEAGLTDPRTERLTEISPIAVCVIGRRAANAL